MPKTDPKERLLVKVDKNGSQQAHMETPCWVWTAQTNHRGYGMFWYNGRDVPAHRASYDMFVGSPGELFVLHKCDNPSCVRPDHLFLGTQSDNVRDAVSKGRHHQQRARKTLRERFTENTRRESNGCWTWVGPMKSSRRNIYPTFKYKGKPINPRRLIWEKTKRTKLGKTDYVIQTCGNDRCVSPRHLKVVGPADTSVKPGAKITQDIADKIRLYYDEGVMSQRKLARRYGLSNQQVSDIVRGKAW